MLKKLILDNNALLSWNEYGSADGEPVFYFHGIPGSRLEAKPADIIASKLDIRLIAPDRPGYGDSDLQNNFTPLDWPESITQLADTLGIDHFSTLSLSGGGVYALACAHEIPERIKKLTLISCSAPYETDAMQQGIYADFKPLYELAAADYSAALQQVSQLASSADTLLNVYESCLPAEDLQILSNKEIRAQFLDDLTLAISNGVEGFTADLRCFSSPWQFNLEDIQTEVDIWHGYKDKNVGFVVAEYLASRLKNNTTHFMKNSGHLFLFDHWHDVLESIKSKAI
jgi:pimeloyl-ACP methyl ester carboxylesterase